MSFRATSMPITPRISWFWEQRPGSAMGSVPPPAPKASLCSRKRPHPCPVRSADLPTAPSSPGCSGHAGPRACLVLPQWGAHLLLPGTILRQVEYWERPCHHQPQPLQGEGEDRVVFMASHTPLQVLRAGVQGQATFLAPLFELPPPPGGRGRGSTLWVHPWGKVTSPTLLGPGALPARPRTRWSIAPAWPPCPPAPWACRGRLDIPGEGTVGRGQESVPPTVPSLFCLPM